MFLRQPTGKYLRRSGKCLSTRAPAVLLASLFALTACSSSHSHPEKVLYVYNWADYIGKDTVQNFEKKTGIRVIYDTYDSDEELEAKLLAGDAGYDAVTTSADYFARQIKAGVYQPLDRRQLPNWKNLDPHVLAMIAPEDPGNRYAVPYMRHVNGFAYNVDAIRARMPDAPVNSLDMLFKPQVISRFASCGVSFLDSAEDVLQLALNYLHLDPNTTSPQDYLKAEKLLLAVRPFIRAFDSEEYMNGLINGDFCISMSYSGDYAVSEARARAAGLRVDLAFTVPREGADYSFDAWLIPEGAPHPQAALQWLNYLMEPQVIAAITNEIHYGNDNIASDPYVDPKILHDPTIYPTPQLEARLYRPKEVSANLERMRTRIWMKVKTGI
ncbi:MAG TPA: polyamine ABC transporter substrate-binding protein [Steroidobacteraceae bacterium]|jgi:putrescine transport system substrate-binding protein|nr:polyamine ABC transporter substrate-binding protein [Steroidobacteraceae bacterium]